MSGSSSVRVGFVELQNYYKIKIEMERDHQRGRSTNIKVGAQQIIKEGAQQIIKEGAQQIRKEGLNKYANMVKS